MNAEQLNHLKSLAKKATPGPWEWKRGRLYSMPEFETGRYGDGSSYGTYAVAIVQAYGITDEFHGPTKEYIAACDPNTILTLIDRIEYLEKTLQAEVLLNKDWSNDEHETRRKW